MIMFWFSLYHDYFITKIRHFLFPVLTILPNDFIYLHKPSTILIWPPPFISQVGYGTSESDIHIGQIFNILD